MSESRQDVRRDDSSAARDVLYTAMFHREDGKLWTWAIATAIVLHVVFLVMRFPEIKAAIDNTKEDKPIIYVRKYVPPPPKIEQPKVQVVKKLTRKVPIPDPTPDEPEPIREPEPEVVPEPLPVDAEILIGDPEPPPPTGPLIAGVGGVTVPELIPESKLKPIYPELARKAKIDGNVILQAIILKDGTVGDIQVLRCNRPNLGFEDAAVEAVRQWRYKPGTQSGKPVDVYLTVKVDFVLE